MTKILHPFSNIKNQISIIDKAHNYNIYENNTKYLDFISGLYNCGLGYSQDTLINKAAKVYKSLPFAHHFGAGSNISQSNVYVERLTEKLLNQITFGEHVHYTNGGAEAVDVALSVCLKNEPRRTKIISYNISYHGSTFLTTASSGNLGLSDYRNIRVDFFDYNHSMTKDEYLSYVEKTIINHGPETIACFIMEPMIGASGGFLMKENVLPEIQKICKKYGIITILDEVISGFYRLGSPFAFQLYNVQPDIIVLSKQLTNGYFPLAVCIFSKKLNFNDIRYGFTTSAHPVGCAIATEVLNTLETEIFSQHLNKNIEMLSKLLADLYSKKYIYKIQQQGMFAALHFSQSKDTLIPLEEKNYGGDVATQARSKGLIVRGNPKSLILAPGFYMDQSHYDFCKSVLEEIL